MLLEKWNPWREIEDMFDRYTKAFNWPRATAGEALPAADWTPRVDIAETESEYIIDAELPGIAKEDVRVNVESGVLTIRGERRQVEEEKNSRFHRIERVYGMFSRRFTLPDDANDSGITSSFRDGVLKVRIPKTTEPKTAPIEVAVD